MLYLEREKELADFIVFNKKEIAMTLYPKLKEHWFFKKHWDSGVRKHARQLYSLDLVRLLRELLVESHTATTLEAVTLITPEFIYKTTGKFFLKEENFL